MAFNLGVFGLTKFQNTLAFIEAGDYESASEEMLRSRWAEQVGARALDLASRTQLPSNGSKIRPGQKRQGSVLFHRSIMSIRSYCATIYSESNVHHLLPRTNGVHDRREKTKVPRERSTAGQTTPIGAQRAAKA